MVHQTLLGLLSSILRFCFVMMGPMPPRPRGLVGEATFALHWWVGGAGFPRQLLQVFAQQWMLRSAAPAGSAAEQILPPAQGRLKEAG